MKIKNRGDSARVIVRSGYDVKYLLEDFKHRLRNGLSLYKNFNESASERYQYVGEQSLQYVNNLINKSFGTLYGEGYNVATINSSFNNFIESQLLSEGFGNLARNAWQGLKNVGSKIANASRYSPAESERQRQQDLKRQTAIGQHRRTDTAPPAPASASASAPPTVQPRNVHADSIPQIMQHKDVAHLTKNFDLMKKFSSQLNTDLSEVIKEIETFWHKYSEAEPQYGGRQGQTNKQQFELARDQGDKNIALLKQKMTTVLQQVTQEITPIVSNIEKQLATIVTIKHNFDPETERQTTLRQRATPPPPSELDNMGAFG